MHLQFWLITRNSGKLSAQAAGLIADEKQNLMFSSIDDLTEQLTEIRTLLTDLKTNTDATKQSSAAALNKLNTVETKVNRLECDLSKAKKQIADLQQKLVDLESYGRRSNLLFYGVSEDDTENCEEKVKWIIKNKMGIENTDSMKIERAHRMPGVKPPESTRTRPIIIRFNWYKDRETVWGKRSKLKDTNFWVNEDFPYETNQKRRILQPIVSAARKLGMRATLIKDTLLLDGKTYTVETLSTLPDQLNPSKIATPNIGDDKQGFWGEQSPCSNFHSSDFEVDDVTFHWNEQYYHYEKAVFLEDEAAKASLLQCTSPQACLKVGKELNKKLDLPKWRAEHGLDVMYKGCLEKFRQNPNLKRFLLSTEDRTLIEASPYDDFWGVKLHLRDTENLKDESKWKGLNHLGKILVKVRDTLKVG